MQGIVVQTFQPEQADKLNYALDKYPDAKVVGILSNKKDKAGLKYLASMHDRELITGVMEEMPESPMRPVAMMAFAFAISGAKELILGTEPAQISKDMVKACNLKLRVIK